MGGYLRCVSEVVSTRLGIELVVDPAFTARAYRTRNILCGQYGSWAAEMHMLRMSLVTYFECPDIAVDQLAKGVGRVAEESNNRNPQFSMNYSGVSMCNEGKGIAPNAIYLEFGQLDSNHPLITLHRDALALVDELPGTTLPVPSNYGYKIYLMEHSALSATVMGDASNFAKGVALDVGVPEMASAWRLVLLRYHSESAGDDWSNGSWASDIWWEYLASYPL